MPAFKRSLHSNASGGAGTNISDIKFNDSRNYKQKVEVENDQEVAVTIESTEVGSWTYWEAGGLSSITYTVGVSADEQFAVMNHVDIGTVWNITKTELADITASNTDEHTIGLVISSPVSAAVSGQAWPQTTFTVLGEGAYDATSIGTSANGLIGTFTYAGSGDVITWSPELWNFLDTENPGSRTAVTSGDQYGNRMKLFTKHKDNFIVWNPQMQKLVGICINNTIYDFWLPCDAPTLVSVETSAGSGV
jgi:hypothetical protein